MSLSSLPDIFRESQSASTYHRKQGGSFSLNLHAPLSGRPGLARSESSQGGRQYRTLELNKQRSVSSSAMRQKNSGLSDENSKTNFTERNKNQVTFRDRVQIMGSSAVKRGSGLAVINISNVCYQTSRRFNNRMVDLEQADSLKNNTELNLREVGMAEMQLEDIRKASREIQSTFRAYITNAVNDLSYFQAEFAEALKNCYSNLSKLRRQTNEELRANRKEIDKVSQQFAVCKSVLNDMTQKSEQIASQTILVQNEPQQSASQVSPLLDFEEISEIPKTSRGGTGSVSKRTKMLDLLSRHDKARRSADCQLGLQQLQLD